MINCITIDDEPLAHKIVLKYCEHLDFIEVVKSFRGAVEAIGYLNSNKVDLIFLDINMPVLQGLEFLRTLNDPPMVIITSAYQEYALESFELNVIDYLLKPFSFERFLKAVNKAEQYQKLVEGSTTRPSQASSEKDDRIFVKSDKKIHQIKLDDILYLESYGSYVKIHLAGEMIMTLERLTHYEKSLPENSFVRVHKSYIVATNKIQTIEGNRIHLQGNQIPIGQVYKLNVSKLLR